MSLPDYLEKHIADHHKAFNINPNRVACASLSKGDKHYIIGSTGCHAGLRTGNRTAWEYIISSICRGYRSYWKDILPVGSPKWKEVEEVYVNYLINNSPWADIFPVKDPNYYIDQGAWVVSTDHPSNIIVGALIATRALTEKCYRTIIFHDLVKGGVKNEDMAFLVAEMSVLSSDSPKNTPDISYGKLGSAHTPILAAWATESTVHNFLSHKPKVELQKYKKRNTYDSIHDTFVGSGMDTLVFASNPTEHIRKSFFHNNLFPRMKALLDGEETVSRNNPFTKAKEVLAEADEPFNKRSFKYTDEHLSKLVQAVNEITPREYL